MTMQAVGIDSYVYLMSHEGSLFEASVGARARFGLNEKIFTYARAGTQIICNVMDL